MLGAILHASAVSNVTDLPVTAETACQYEPLQLHAQKQPFGGAESRIPPYGLRHVGSFSLAIVCGATAEEAGLEGHCSLNVASNFPTELNAVAPMVMLAFDRGSVRVVAWPGR